MIIHRDLRPDCPRCYMPLHENQGKGSRMLTSLIPPLFKELMCTSRTGQPAQVYGGIVYLLPGPVDGGIGPRH